MHASPSETAGREAASVVSRAGFGARLGDAVRALRSGRGDIAASARIALFAYGVRIVSAVIAFGSQVFLARLMGGAEYGVFVFVLVLSVIVGGLSCVGFQTAVIRFVPEYRTQNRLALMRGIHLASRVFAATAATALALLGFLLLWTFRDAIAPYYVRPLLLGLLCLPAMAVGEVMDGTARAHSLASLALLPTFIVRPLLIIGFMTAAVWGFDAEPRAETAVVALVAAAYVSTLGQIVLVGRRAASAVGSGPRQVIFSTWLKVAAPIFLVEGFFNLLTNVDILLVGHFMPPEDVAVYYASVKTLALVHFVYFAVKASAAQRFSQYRHGGDRQRFEHFVAQAIRWTFWPSLVVAVVLLVGGELLLQLFGPDFDAGYPLLFVLIVGVLARASVGPAESVLTMSGEQKSCAVLYLGTILLNIALNLVLIPRFGLPGAATATASAMVFEAFCLYAIARRRLGVHLFVFARATAPVPAG